MIFSKKKRRGGRREQERFSRQSKLNTRKLIKRYFSDPVEWTNISPHGQKLSFTIYGASYPQGVQESGAGKSGPETWSPELLKRQGDTPETCSVP